MLMSPNVDGRRKRARTAQACMHCRRRRIKCTGESPCASCVKLNRPCEYETAPKKPRVSHKGVIATLKSENQRLREEIHSLRVAASMKGVASPATAGTSMTVPQPTELKFLETYLEFEASGLLNIVGRSRFADLLHALRTGATPRTLDRDESMLYFTALAVGAALRRQEVPSSSYSSRVRAILADSYDRPSESTVRVCLLLAVLYGSLLDAAKEACYLSMAIQMLSILECVTGRAAPDELVLTAAAVTCMAQCPLPFSSPKSATSSCALTNVAYLIAQAVAQLMAVDTLDTDALMDILMQASNGLATLQATCGTVPLVHAAMLHGLRSIALVRAGDAAEGIEAARLCATVACAPQCPGWAHPAYAFVLRHVGVLLATADAREGADLGRQVHKIAMAWPQAAVYFRSMQNDLRSQDDVLKAELIAGVARATPGGSPTIHPSAARPVATKLRLDPRGCGSPTAQEGFSYVQMVTLALGKPFNTLEAVLRAPAASTKALLASGHVACAGSSPCHAAAVKPEPTTALPKPAASWETAMLPVDLTTAADKDFSFLDAALGVSAVRRGSMSLLDDACVDDLADMLLSEDALFSLA